MGETIFLIIVRNWSNFFNEYCHFYFFAF